MKAGRRLKRIFRGTHFAGLRLGAAALAMIHVVGTLGYHYLGRPSATWIDSFYMTCITVATIGFSETVDLSRHPMGRLFTVGIAFLGIGTMTYMFSTFVALLLESDLNTALKRKRMKRKSPSCRVTTSFVASVAWARMWPTSWSRPIARWS